MKVYIEFDFKDVCGGGNNFLFRLSKQFGNLNVLSSSKDADVILFNSHHNIDKVKELRRIYPNKVFVHRVDGPMRLYNKKSDQRDDIVVNINKQADAIVFQSFWSKEKNIEMYPLLSDKRSIVILNACEINKDKVLRGNSKIIAVSMSDNINKGYDIYNYLDKNLDFGKYEFSFIGRSPVFWSNIKNLGIMGWKDVSNELIKHDIFITASKNDPCSNSLIEGMSMGLVPLALNSGGHPEIIRKGGLLFQGEEDVIEKISKISSNIEVYRNNIDIASISDVALKYVNFFTKLITK